MFDKFGSLFNRKPAVRGKPLVPEPPSQSLPLHNASGERKASYSRVFRWNLPDGQTKAPGLVEIAGSFTHWQKIPLMRDSALDGWHVTIHHIAGNRMHHYMLLIDGHPTLDRNCDGLAAPHGPEEERFQLKTEKGPRVLMMFAQTK